MKKINTKKLGIICSIFLLFFINKISINAQTPTYGYVAIGGGGFVVSIIESLTEPNVFYAKTDVGGINRWNEATQTWTPLFGWCSVNETSFMGTESFAIDASSPNKVYALAGTNYWNNGKSAILRSADHGDTWETVDVTAKFKANGNGSERQRGENLAVDPANGNILYCGTRYNNGLFRSIDAGKTWDRVTSFPDSIGLKYPFSFTMFDYDSAIPNVGCSTIYVASFKTGNNLFVSKDAGATWQIVPGGHSTGKPNRCAMSVSDRNFYITYGGGGVPAIKRYNLTNLTWNDITPNAYGGAFSGIAVDMNAPNKIVATTSGSFSNQQPWGWSDFIFYSENYGATWKEKANKNTCSMDENGVPWISHHAMHWVSCATMNHSKPGWVFLTSGNGLFATENITATQPVWKFMAKGMEETVANCFISIPKGPFISAVGDQNGFVHTDISKAPATAFESMPWGFAYAGQKPSTIVRTNSISATVNNIKTVRTRVLISEDNGTTWTPTLTDISDTIERAIPAISSNGKIVVWKGYDKNLGTRCYWTNDRGATWNKIGLLFNANPIGDAVDSLKFYAFNTGNGYMYVSKDGCKTFKPTVYLGEGGTSTIKSPYNKGGHVWINNAGKLKYSTDSAKTFTTTNIYRCVAFALGKEAPGADYLTIYIWGQATSTGPEAMYRSIDKGVSWTRANDDKHQWGLLANAGMIEGDQNIYGLVYKSTAGMGIPWMGIDGYTATNKISANDNNAKLYPNPFKSSIYMTLNNNVQSVLVYNQQGMLVKKINVQNLQNETIQFGDELVSGVYLVKVIDKNSSYTNKIIKHAE